jgi:hypothetical protein
MIKGGMKTKTLIHINIETLTASVRYGVANPHQTIPNDKKKLETEVQEDTETAEVEKKIIINHQEGERDHVHQEGQDLHVIDMTVQEKKDHKGIDMTVIDMIEMVEIIIEIENTVNVTMIIIANHLAITRVATTEIRITTASSSSLKKRSIHTSNAKRKTKMP